MRPPGKNQYKDELQNAKEKLKYSLPMAYYKLSNICVVFGGRIPVYFEILPNFKRSYLQTGFIFFDSVKFPGHSNVSEYSCLSNRWDALRR